MATGLGADGPFAGHARQRITLEPGRLRCRLGLHADTPHAPLVPSMDPGWPA